MRRPWVAGLGPAALAGALLLAGCGGGAVGGSNSPVSSTTTTTVVTNTKLRLGVEGPLPACLPVGSASNEAGDALADLLLPSPFYSAANGLVNPNLDLLENGRAEVVNTEPFTVVYEVNPKARWSNGQPLRAGDFVTAWRVRAVSNVPAFAPYRLVKSVRASDRGLTVTAVFTERYADWRSLFAQLIPKDLEPVPGLDACLPVDTQLPTATPWRFAGLASDAVSLSVNPRWWGDPPPFSGVDLAVAANQAQLAGWVASGTLDVGAAINPSAQDISMASRQRGFVRRIGLTGELVDLEFATTSGPTENLTLRRALVATLDRQALVTATTGASSLQHTPAASHLFAPNVSAYPSGTYPSPTGYPSDAPPTPRGALAAPVAQPELAAKLLAKARYRRSGPGWVAESGKALELRLAVPVQAPLASVGKLVAAQLSASGIPTTTEAFPSSSAAGAALASGVVDAAILLRSLSAFPTQTSWWYSRETGNHGELDYSGFADPQVDYLLNEASQELNPVYAVEDYRGVDELLWTQAPTLPLMWLPQLWSARGNLIGPELATLGLHAAEITNWRRTTSQPQPRNANAS